MLVSAHSLVALPQGSTGIASGMSLDMCGVKETKYPP